METANEIPDGYAVSLRGRNVPGICPGVAYAATYDKAHRQWVVRFNNFAKSAAPVWGSISTGDLILSFSIESIG